MRGEPSVSCWLPHRFAFLLRRDLLTIRCPELWMGVDRVFIQRGGVINMHVRTNQNGNQKATAAFYSLEPPPRSEICTYFGSPSIFNEHVGMRDWPRAIRRNQCDIMDDDVASNGYLRLCVG
jgi:hypothetical protein